MAVAGRDPIESLDSASPQIRHYCGFGDADAVFDKRVFILFIAIVRIESDTPAAVEQHQRALRKADQHRVALPDIEESDAQSSTLEFVSERMNGQQPA